MMPNFWKKVAKTVAKPKNATKQANFENPNHLHQTTFKVLKHRQQTMF